MRIRRKWIVAVIVGVVAIPAVACAGIVGFLLLKPPIDAYVHSTRFESTSWKTGSSHDDDSWPTRLRMADDLLERKLLAGRSRAQVEELLGPADRTQYFQDWDLVYKLGPERGMYRIDSEWLVVRFDSTGKVAESRLVQD